MEKYFKYIVISMVAIFIIAIFLISKSPNRKERIIEKINSELPRNIGTLGRWESITYQDGILTYNMTVSGGDETELLYRQNYDDVREFMLYGIIQMNGQRNMGKTFAQLLDYYKEKVKLSITLSNNSTFSWEYITGRMKGMGKWGYGGV